MGHSAVGEVLMALALMLSQSVSWWAASTLQEREIETHPLHAHMLTSWYFWQQQVLSQQPLTHHQH